MADHYEPILSPGHHLGASRKNDGVFSGNSFDDSGTLGRPDWRRVEKDEAEESEEAPDLLKVAIGFAVGVVVTIAAVKAAPHIKSRLNALKSKRNRRSEASEADSRAATGELATLSRTARADFSSEVDAALEDCGTTMSSAEAQRRLLALLMAAAFIADQMRALSNARIEDIDASLELKSAMEKLTAPQITDSINRALETDSSLLDEATSAELMKIFGGGRVVHGQYVPLRNDKIKDALRLTSGEM